jgi:hypothetical protein
MGLQVKVIFKRQVKALYKTSSNRDFDRLYEGLDFGLWDEDLVMSIVRKDDGSRRMRVSVAGAERTSMEKRKGELSAEAKNFEELFDINHLGKSVNTWSNFSDLISLVPPNGPHEEDVARMLAMASDSLQKRYQQVKGRITILGLTQGLLDAAKTLQQFNKDLDVEVIDQRGYHRDLEKIRPESANWLKLGTEYRSGRNSSDVIIGDDIICNIAPWQLPIFFESIGSLLKPGGPQICPS